MAENNSLGPLLRLWGITVAQLPDPSATPDTLAPFLTSILEEALPFISSAASPTAGSSTSSLWKSKGTKSFSSGPVAITERTVPASDLSRIAATRPSGAQPVSVPSGGETWACRRSVHADSPTARGTASWPEFRAALKEHHAESEEAFTPGVVGARTALRWDCGSHRAAAAGGERWGAFTLALQEMRHRAGRPVVKDRAFGILQMTCAALDEGGRERPDFLVANIPVADMAASTHAKLVKDEGVVEGAYVSVERIRKLPGDSKEIEWLMATASDARGSLPMWLQTMAIPAQIAKDVPLFLDWVAKEREKGHERENVAPAGTAGAGDSGSAPEEAVAMPTNQKDKAVSDKSSKG